MIRIGRFLSEIQKITQYSQPKLDQLINLKINQYVITITNNNCYRTSKKQKTNQKNRFKLVNECTYNSR